MGQILGPGADLVSQLNSVGGALASQIEQHGEGEEAGEAADAGEATVAAAKQRLWPRWSRRLKRRAKRREMAHKSQDPYPSIFH